MRVRVERLGEGLHPSEVIVGIRTPDGSLEKILVDRDSVADDTLEIGFPVGGQGDHFLVGLPRETFAGAWRIWVSRDQLLGRVGGWPR